MRGKKGLNGGEMGGKGEKRWSGRRWGGMKVEGGLKM